MSCLHTAILLLHKVTKTHYSQEYRRRTKNDWGLFTKTCQDSIDLLVKGTAHTRMKVIGGKTTVKTSATFDIGR